MRLGATKLRVLDLFSGIGGFSLGLERSGVLQTVAFCENDQKCRRVLRRHWPDTPIYEDVRTLTASRLAADGIAVDLVCGGFPCQPFSSAARGRNNKPDLWPEMLRLVRELRPVGVLAENVPGLGDRGVDRVCGDLEHENYTVWPFDLDTAPPGRSRGRRRLIFMAYANSQGQSRRAFNAKMASIPKISGRREADNAPPLGMDDGLPGRMDALRQLGNSISPWFTERLGSAFVRSEKMHFLAKYKSRITSEPDDNLDNLIWEIDELLRAQRTDLIESALAKENFCDYSNDIIVGVLSLTAVLKSSIPSWQAALKQARIVLTERKADVERELVGLSAD